MALTSLVGLGSGAAAGNQKTGKTAGNTLPAANKTLPSAPVTGAVPSVTGIVAGGLLGPLSAQEEKKKKGGWTGSTSGAAASSGAYTAKRVSGAETEPEQDPYYDEMRAGIRAGYADQLSTKRVTAEKALERSRQSAEEQRRALGDEYAGTNRQLYRDYMEHRRTLPQEMAARGYNGGLTESSQLRLRNSYEEGLGQNERARIAQEAKINSALAQQEYETRSAADRANAQARQSMYASLMDLRGQEHQEDRSDAAQRAAALAAAGDYSGYRALGWSEGEIAYLSSMWGAKNPRLQANQSYGHFSAGGNANASTARQVAEYLRGIYGTDAAMDYVAEELANRNILEDEADPLRKYLRGEA